LGIPVVPELKTSKHRVRTRVGPWERPRARRDRIVQVQHRHHPGQQRAVPDRVLRTRYRKDVFDLAPLPHGTDQHDRRAEPPDGEHCHDEFGPAGRHERDALPGPHPAPGQDGREAVGKRLQLRAGVLPLLEGEHRRGAGRCTGLVRTVSARTGRHGGSQRRTIFLQVWNRNGVFDNSADPSVVDLYGAVI
jgi:hypothetical protein